MRTVTCILFVLAITACTQRYELVDQGQVCVYATDDADRFPLLGSDERPEQTFEVGQPVYFHYLLNECLSSSCDTDRSAGCEARLEGDLLRIHSTAAYTAGSASSCTADCGLLTAGCASEPLSAGTYRIRHGDDEVTLTIPSTTATPCVGPSP